MLTEPAAIGLDAGVGELLGLEVMLQDLPGPVPEGAFLSLARLTSSECRGLPDTFTALSFFFAIAREGRRREEAVVREKRGGDEGWGG
uniref:Uncharacterized protein n=1 Tax=Oryza brachyantha TaxID=4533 RepID=J3LNT0_ORYBR